MEKLEDQFLDRLSERWKALRFHHSQMIIAKRNIVFSQCINITFTNRILHITILVTHNFKIEDRCRKVATLLAQSMTETE
jgi:hypothetical protein